ncbi:MAG: hypothetical protein NC219_10620 [Prevotella sp.]|nr:hypothetical protein [Prevotella sp.]
MVSVGGAFTPFFPARCGCRPAENGQHCGRQAIAGRAAQSLRAGLTAKQSLMDCFNANAFRNDDDGACIARNPSADCGAVGSNSPCSFDAVRAALRAAGVFGQFRHCLMPVFFHFSFLFFFFFHRKSLFKFVI